MIGHDVLRVWGVVVIYVFVIVMIALLSYEQGEYAGMRSLCPNGLIVEQDLGFSCVSVVDGDNLSFVYSEGGVFG